MQATDDALSPVDEVFAHRLAPGVPPPPNERCDGKPKGRDEFLSITDEDGRSFLRMRAFSFEKEPFPNTADRAFYFSTPALTARLEELGRALEHANVLLVDEPGSGKSTMLDMVTAAAAGRFRAFYLRGLVQYDAKALTHALVSTFGLPLREPVVAELRDADTFLEMITARSRNVVIVIDDAHLLEPDALGQLKYLAKRWEKYGVRFLIGAEPDLMPHLEALPGTARFSGAVATFDMPRFDHEQVSDYLHMCLCRAGLVGDSPFDADLVSIVTRRSRGLVGAVGSVARELLERIMAGEKRPQRRPRGLLRRWRVAVVAAGALGVVLTIAIPDASTMPDEAQAPDRGQAFQSVITPAPRLGADRRRKPSASADVVAP